MNEIDISAHNAIEIKDLGTFDGPLLCFGGPYSNLEASQALLAEADRLSIPRDHMICTGDLVAYCANPAETVSLFQDEGIHIIQGNCEENLAREEETCGCGFEPGSTCAVLSERWFDLASKSISKEQKIWMGKLPKRLKFNLAGKRFYVLHGTHHNISEFVFPSSNDDRKVETLRQVEADCIIAGHCGLPYTQKVAGGYWHNPGALGLPANDGTRRIWYSLIEPGDNGLIFRHLPLDYDADCAASSMRSLGLNDYANTLLDGLHPSISVLPAKERTMTGVALQISTTYW